MEIALRYFSVFGGLNKKINTNIAIEKLIEAMILDDYRFYRNEISTLTSDDNIFRAILSGVALGDRRTNSAFKKARVSFNEGMDCVDELRQMDILSLESPLSHFKKPFEFSQVSDKLHFSAPFLRFWFAFVSPIFQGIKEGNYEEFFERFKNREAEFGELVFEQLFHELFRTTLQDDKIDELGRYWDEELQIDLLCKTRSEKIIAGTCRYTNAKMKKTELTKLKESCEKIGIKPDKYVLFAKNGFSNELKSMKGESLRLFTCKSLKVLLD